MDDYYLNLIDWSANDVLAVGLDSSFCVWSASSDKEVKLNYLGENNQVTSVGW